MQGEAQASLEQLPFQVGMTVDVDLDGKREPGLQSDVDQAQLGIEEMKVKPLRCCRRALTKLGRSLPPIKRKLPQHSMQQKTQISPSLIGRFRRMASTSLSLR